MIHLLIVSLIWAFSFGLIKYFLAGVDFTLVSALRLGLAALLFLPFLRLRGVGWARVGLLLAIGAVQYGCMYLLYIASFAVLAAHEVALFTIFTPIYVILLEDLLTRRFHRRHLLVAVLAVVGTGIIKFRDPQTPELLTGVLLLQGANLCFALGQVAYRRLSIGGGGREEVRVYGLLYLGAVGVTLPVALVRTGGVVPELDLRQVQVLLYLGVVASGVCFFLWNHGARRVQAVTLAVANNLKVPLAVAVSLVVFAEHTNLFRLLLGGSILLTVLFLGADPPAARRS